MISRARVHAGAREAMGSRDAAGAKTETQSGRMWFLPPRRSRRLRVQKQLLRNNSAARSSSEGHKPGKVCAETFHNRAKIKSECGAMRSFHNSSFDPQTLLLLETVFDEAWLTLKFVGNKTVKPDELARSVLRVAMDGERDPVR